MPRSPDGAQRNPGMLCKRSRVSLRSTRATILRRLESALQQLLDQGVEIFEFDTLYPLAIDEETRGRIDLQHLAGVFLVGGDLVEQGLIFQTLLDRLLAEPRLLADPGQGVGGVLQHPVV